MGPPHIMGVKIMYKIRTSVTFHPRYSAMPPHTPEIILFDLDRFNCLPIVFNFKSSSYLSYDLFARMFQMKIKRYRKIIDGEDERADNEPDRSFFKQHDQGDKLDHKNKTQPVCQQTELNGFRRIYKPNW